MVALSAQVLRAIGWTVWSHCETEARVQGFTVRVMVGDDRETEIESETERQRQR